MPRGLTVQQPEDEPQDHTDDEARHDREMKAEVPALDHDVAGQPTEPEFAEPWPQRLDDNEHEDQSRPATVTAVLHSSSSSTVVTLWGIVTRAPRMLVRRKIDFRKSG